MKVKRPAKEVAAGVRARADGGLNQVVALEMVETGWVGNIFWGQSQEELPVG